MENLRHGPNKSSQHTYGVGLNVSVGIATRYRLDGPGVESRFRQDFPHPSRPALEPTQPPIKCVLGIFADGKEAEAWR